MPGRLAQLPADLLQRRAAAVQLARPGARCLPVRARAAGGRRAHRDLRVPGADRGVHLVLGPVRRQPGSVPGLQHGAAAAVRPADRWSACPSHRSPGPAVGDRPSTGAVRAAQLGPAGRRGNGRRIRCMAPGAKCPRRSPAGGGRLPEDLSAAVRAAARPGPPVPSGPGRGRAGGPGQHGRRPGRQPAVRPDQPIRLGDDVCVPAAARGRRVLQQHLVLGLTGDPPEHLGAQRAGRRPRAARAGTRLGVRRSAPATRGQLPVPAGLRGCAGGVPAGQQGALAAVRPVAAAVLRPAQGGHRLVGGVRGRGRSCLRRGLPLAEHPDARRGPRAGPGPAESPVCGPEPPCSSR